MGGRRRVSKISRLKGVGRLVVGSAQVGVGAAGFSVSGPLGKIGSALFTLSGSHNIIHGGRQAFARTSKGSGSGGRQKGHPFYGNQYVKVSSRNKARKR